MWMYNVSGILIGLFTCLVLFALKDVCCCFYRTLGWNQRQLTVVLRWCILHMGLWLANRVPWHVFATFLPFLTIHRDSPQRTTR